jgi:hypothetical protein
MADFNIPAGTTVPVSSLTGSNTVEGNSTAAYGAGGGTLNVMNALPGSVSVTVTGGILDIDSLANNDTFTLDNSTLDMTGSASWNTNTIINFADTGTGVSGVIVPPSEASLPNLGGADFTGMNNGDYISTGSSAPITNVSWSSGTLNFTQNSINYAVAVANPASTNFTVGTINGQQVVVDGAVVCFAEGTLILTPRGEVAIEELKVGDLVVTSSGAHRPIKWVGHKTFDLRNLPRTHPARPVRIAADAFGPARPSRDLFLSAPHSVRVDLCGDMLINIGTLINGATIARFEADEITYWHVELDSHDILFASNLGAESYLAMGNRGAFEGESLDAFEEGRDRTHADFCRPVLAKGPVLDFVRERLVARAEELGWTRTRESDLRLIVDGQVVRPLTGEGAAAFLFPGSAKDVRLVSNTFFPPSLGSGDQRELGVMLEGLSFSGSLRANPADDERLRDGLHPVEDHGGGARRRWTKGEAVLDPELWSGLSGQIALLVAYDDSVTRGWTAPAQSQLQSEPLERPKLYAIK